MNIKWVNILLSQYIMMGVHRTCKEASTFCPMRNFLGFWHQVVIILLSMPVKLGAIYDKFLVYTSICWYFSFVTKSNIWNLANNLLLLYPISVWSVCCPRATVKICNLKDKNSNPKQHLKTILLITHKNKSQWNTYLKQGF